VVYVANLASFLQLAQVDEPPHRIGRGHRNHWQWLQSEVDAALLIQLPLAELSRTRLLTRLFTNQPCTCSTRVSLKSMRRCSFSCRWLSFPGPGYLPTSHAHAAHESVSLAHSAAAGWAFQDQAIYQQTMHMQHTSQSLWLIQLPLAELSRTRLLTNKENRETNSQHRIQYKTWETKNLQNIYYVLNI
jgi:hypothetical protein